MNGAAKPIDTQRFAARLRQRFGYGIGADEEFWVSRAEAAYATLIELDAPAPIAPVLCDKRDRRGWVALRSRQMSLNFT